MDKDEVVDATRPGAVEGVTVGAVRCKEVEDRKYVEAAVTLEWRPGDAEETSDIDEIESAMVDRRPGLDGPYRPCGP